MAEDATASPGLPSPLSEEGVASAQSSPPAPSANSPFGLPSQYQKGKRLHDPFLRKSVTGATPEDPARLLTAQQVTRDPDWAAPMRGFTKPLKDYSTSVATYWIGYGLIQTILTLLMAALTGSLGQYSGNTVFAMLTFGPLFGVFLNLLIIISTSWFAAFGVIFMICEPALFLLFYFSSEWRDRLKCCGLLLALITVRVLVGTLAMK